jgi:hypothetical protein
VQVLHVRVALPHPFLVTALDADVDDVSDTGVAQLFELTEGEVMLGGVKVPADCQVRRQKAGIGVAEGRQRLARPGAPGTPFVGCSHVDQYASLGSGGCKEVR